MHRRDFIRTGVAAGAGLAMPTAILAARGGSIPDGWVIDGRDARSQRLAGEGARFLVHDGDATALWVETLDRRWARPGFVLAGVTRPDLLFVLETLAHGRGRRVTARAVLPGGEGGGLIAWTIAPVHPAMRA